MPATTDRSVVDAVEGEDRPADALNRCLREYGASVARRELETAFESLDGLTPAQRRTLALTAGRIAAGVLDPARRGVDDEATAETVRRLFEMDEHVRDRR